MYRRCSEGVDFQRINAIVLFIFFFICCKYNCLFIFYSLNLSTDFPMNTPCENGECVASSTEQEKSRYKHKSAMSRKSILMSILTEDTEMLRTELKSLQQNTDLLGQKELLQEALGSACMQGRVSCLRVLLSAGAEVNVKNPEGKTPLMLAIQHSPKRHAFDVVDNLMSVGADVHVTDHGGKTPLMLALEHTKDQHIINCLLSAGSKVNTSDYCGNTVLVLALEHEHTSDVIMSIIDAGADVNVSSFTNKVPLVVAMEKTLDENIIEKILSAGADVNQKDTDFGRTPLMYAIWYLQKNSIVKKLLGLGANVNETDFLGYTALMEAGYLPHIDIIETLVQSGANVNAINVHGNTLLIQAILHSQHINVIKCFVDAGADINMKDAREVRSPLMAAIETKYIPVAEFLADQGVEVYDEIHAAIMKGPDCNDLIKKLISTSEPQLCELPKILIWEFSHLADSLPSLFTTNRISPLLTALLIGNLDVIKMIIETNFIHQFDLYLPQDMKTALFRYLSTMSLRDSADVAESVFTQPWSLQSVCLSIISDHIGLNHRDEKLVQTGLPIPLQRKLMHE